VRLIAARRLLIRNRGDRRGSQASPRDASAQVKGREFDEKISTRLVAFAPLSFDTAFSSFGLLFGFSLPADNQTHELSVHWRILCGRLHRHPFLL